MNKYQWLSQLTWNMNIVTRFVSATFNAACEASLSCFIMMNMRNKYFKSFDLLTVRHSRSSSLNCRSDSEIAASDQSAMQQFIARRESPLIWRTLLLDSSMIANRNNLLFLHIASLFHSLQLSPQVHPFCREARRFWWNSIAYL